MYNIKYITLSRARFLSLVIALFLVSCALNTSQPLWVTQPQVDSLYWYGVGFITKPYVGDDIRKAARQNALDEIASQIKINISSDFIDILIDDNQTESSYTESLIRTRVNENLSNIEYTGSYETKDRYYVQARLSKKLYYETIQRKRANATDTALAMYKEAMNNFSVKSISLLNQSMSEIMPFLDDPIYVEYPKGSRSNLYSLIKIAISETIDRISVDPIRDQHTIKLGFKNRSSIQARCYDSVFGTGLSGIHLDIGLESQDIYQSAVTGNDGTIEFGMPKKFSKNKIQYLNIYLNRSSMGAIDINMENSIKSQVKIVLDFPEFAVNASENNLGKKTENPFVMPVIKKVLSDRLNARFIENDGTDFTINTNINTLANGTGPNEWGIYVSYANATFSVIDSKSGDELYSTALNNVKGSSFTSYEDAGNKSLQKIVGTIEKTILPEIISALEEF